MRVRTFVRSLLVLSIILMAAGSRARRMPGREAAAPPLPPDSASADPWSAAELLQPDPLVHRLQAPAGSRPLVVCVGFDFLYQSAHIPGALLYGPGREPSGVKSLEDAAKTWPHDREIVIYCGCCPMKQCPNLRPAFLTLKRMGLTRLGVLDLEHDFRQDWLQKGLPNEKAPGR